MNQLQSMRIFVEVVERNGFGRAAQALQMSPASVSVQVSNLEAHLGTSLLTRTTRNVVPTAEGAEYYKVCKRVLDEIFEVESSFRKLKLSPSGRLRVDAIDSYVTHLIIPVLAEFNERYPDIRIDFVQSGHAFEAVGAGADVMIRMQTHPFEDTTSLIIHPIGDTQLICAASPGYLEEYGVPATPTDLIQHNCLLWIDSATGRLWEWRFESYHDTTLDLPYAFAFSQRQARIDAALQGLGIIYETSCDIAQPLRDGKLIQILKPWVEMAPRSYIIYDQDRQDSAKIQAFVKFMLEKYPPGRMLEPPLKQ